MYNFVDINETSEAVILPSEALCLNGEYIENLIPGYRTLTVEGREALSPELDFFTVGTSDGATPRSKRYPERIIRITYQLIAKSNEDFRKAYNQLGKILNVEDAELIFNDEPDKFFKGTPSYIGEVPPGKNAVTGTFEILCVDPFKYSLLEYEAEPSLEDSSILLDYGGTYKAFPTLVAEFHNEDEASEDGETTQALTGNGDCGYVAFFNENEKIIQLGDPDEVDGTHSNPRSQTLINQVFDKSTSWGSAAQSLWAVNNGVTVPANCVQNGSIGMGAVTGIVPLQTKNTSQTLVSNLHSEQDEPEFVWSVICKSSNRAANSVKLDFSITAALGDNKSYFGKPYILTASLFVGGVWRTVTMKTAAERWEGRTAHTKTLSVTVAGLSVSATSVGYLMFKAERPDTVGQNAGAIPVMAIRDMPISAYAAEIPQSYLLAPSNYGTGTGWHGVTISRDIPADASGNTGAVSGLFAVSHKMHIGSGKNDVYQKGAFQVTLSADDGSVVGGFCISKTANGNKAKLYCTIGDTNFDYVIDLSYNNRYLGASAATTGYSYFKKEGGWFTISVAGSAMSVGFEELAEKVISKVTISFFQYGSHPALMRNGISWAKFIKYNCDTWNDIPNKFSTGDIVEADCKTGDVYFNGVRSPEYGALGNDWEEFYLTPGLNQIGFSYSDWVAEGFEPKCKIRYREVFL